MTAETTILLVRHGQHAMAPDILLGRGEDPGLSGFGEEQAKALASAPWAARVDCVQSSPRRRAVETAVRIAEVRGLSVDICPELDEVDYGRWSGCTFAQLDHDLEWRGWNACRASAQTPAGETMAGIAGRVSNHIRLVAALHAGQCIALVSHAEIIRSLILQISANSFDHWATIEVPMASVHQVLVRDGSIAINPSTEEMRQ